MSRPEARELRLPLTPQGVLRVVDWGDPEGPPLLVALPCGVGADPLRPFIAAACARGRRVLCVEGRAVLEADMAPDAGHDLGAAAHAGDLLRLMELLPPGPVDLLGYCSGALVALNAALQEARRPAPRLRRLALVCGAYTLSETAPDCAYEREFAAMVRSCRGQPRVASVFLRALQARPAAEALGGEFAAHLRAAYRDIATFTKYVDAVHALYASGLPGLGILAGVPTLVLCGSADTIAPPAQSRQVLPRLGRAHWRELAQEDHYGLCRDGSATSVQVLDFLAASVIAAAVPS